MALNVIDTKQMEFATAMLKRLKEEKGSKLIEFTEKASVKGANQYTFYRQGESTIGGNTLNMYADTYTGTGGTTEKFTCVIDYVYAHDKIKSVDINSTSLDIKGSFVSSLSDALTRNVDKKIMDAVVASTVVIAGDNTKAIDDQVTIDAIIETAVFASTLARETSVEGRPDVAIVLDASEFAKLHRAEKIINSNYPNINKFMDNTLFGCEVVKVPLGAKPKGIFLIPNGTIGTASWENDVEAGSEWSFGQDALFCMAKRSLGVVVLEEESIFKVQYSVA